MRAGVTTAETPQGSYSPPLLLLCYPESPAVQSEAEPGTTQSSHRPLAKVWKAGNVSGHPKTLTWRTQKDKAPATRYQPPKFEEKSLRKGFIFSKKIQEKKANPTSSLSSVLPWVAQPTDAFRTHKSINKQKCNFQATGPKGMQRMPSIQQRMRTQICS